MCDHQSMGACHCHWHVARAAEMDMNRKHSKTIINLHSDKHMKYIYEYTDTHSKCLCAHHMEDMQPYMYSHIVTWHIIKRMCGLGGVWMACVHAKSDEVDSNHIVKPCLPYK